jgi:hypothetical protein
MGVMDENPYRAPREDAVANLARRRARVRQLTIATFAGSVAGSIVLSPFLRAPGGPVDPTGSERAFWHGAAYGGLVALAIEVVYLLVKDYRESQGGD